MNTIVLVMWNILSFLISGIFVFQGLLSFQAGNHNVTSIVSSAVLLSYGLLTILIQSVNWSAPSRQYVKFTTYLVGLMLINQLLFRSGMLTESGSGIYGSAIVVMMLAINWLAIDYVADHKKPAE